MNVLQYYVFSSLEYVALFVLMFRLYRLSLANSAWQLFFSCLILTNTDRSVRYMYEIPEFSPIIQVVILFFLVWLVFHVHPLFSAIVAATGYTAYVSLSNLWISVVTYTGIIKMEDLGDPLSLQTVMIQVVTAASAVLLGWIIKAKGIGFNFIPDDTYARVKKSTIRYIVANVIISVGVLLYGFYYLQTQQSFPPFYIISIVFLAAILTLLYLSKKKDEEMTF